MSEIEDGEAHFWVNGIVAQRNNQPYIQLSNEKGMIAQLTMAQARKVAQDILVMASRSEMDAMIHRFMREEIQNGEAAAAMMHLFREYRAEHDREIVESDMADPEASHE